MENEDVLRLLNEKHAKKSDTSALIGFDGFIDSIVRPVKNRMGNDVEYFRSAHDFGVYAMQKQDSNFSIELVEITRKIGGNAPIMACALAEYFDTVNCVGAFGRPEISALFREVPSNCKLYSFAEPGITTAVEFDQGKMILGEMTRLNSATWRELLEVIGIDKLVALMSSSNLIAFVNWAEPHYSAAIWKGMLEQVLPKAKIKPDAYAFFDLSDCSKRTTKEIRDTLNIIQQFGKSMKVVLGLNKNEGNVVASAIASYPLEKNTLDENGQTIYKHLAVDVLVLHHHNDAIAFTKTGRVKVSTAKIENPQISTGAGDNFNAGLCVGLSLGADVEMALRIGHLFAAHYMKSGKSLSIKNLTDHGNQNF